MLKRTLTKLYHKKIEIHKSLESIKIEIQKLELENIKLFLGKNKYWLEDEMGKLNELLKKNFSNASIDKHRNYITLFFTELENNLVKSKSECVGELNILMQYNDTSNDLILLLLHNILNKTNLAQYMINDRSDVFMYINIYLKVRRRLEYFHLDNEDKIEQFKKDTLTKIFKD